MKGNKVKSDLEFLGHVWQCLDSLDFEELRLGFEDEIKGKCQSLGCCSRSVFWIFMGYLGLFDGWVGLGFKR